MSQNSVKTQMVPRPVLPMIPQHGHGFTERGFMNDTGGSGDLLANLVNTEVNVTGAVTATISTMHSVADSGTPAAYTITLPAASGNDGKSIGFKFESGLTKIVTVDGNSSETINGAANRKYVHDESAVFLCDGSNWSIVSEVMYPVSFHATKSSAQSISDVTVTVVQYNVEDWDNNNNYDNSSNYRFTPTAPGIYVVRAGYRLVALADGKSTWVGITKNGTIYEWGQAVVVGAASDVIISLSMVVSMNGTTDYLEGVIFHGHGSARSLHVAVTAYNYFSAIRQDREEQ